MQRGESPITLKTFLPLTISFSLLKLLRNLSISTAIKHTAMYIVQNQTPQWTRVNLNSNRTDPCAGLCHVRQVTVDPILCRLGFNFDGAARLFTVP